MLLKFSALMNSSSQTLRERLPAALIGKLEAFRREVRRIRLHERLLWSLLLVLGGFLGAFFMDRLIDVDQWARLGWAVLILSLVVWQFWQYLSRTILSTEEWTSLARMIEKRFPGPGDRLLGILEIGADDQEWTRSRTLSMAAISQVSAELRVTDLDQALPKPRFQLMGSGAFAAGFVILVLSFLIPQPVLNTAVRWSAPWLKTERYTFVQIEPISSIFHSARGEDYEIILATKPESPWKPQTARVHLDGRDTLTIPSDSEGQYRIAIDGHSDARKMSVRLGDRQLTLQIDPKVRSSITTAQLNVTLPDYLNYSKPLIKDARSGLISLLRQSVGRLEMHLDRPLRELSADPLDSEINGSHFSLLLGTVTNDLTTTISWKDEFGLAGVSPYKFQVQVEEDALPGLAVEGLARSKVLLENDAIAFNINVSDDYGILEVGMEWSGDGDPEQSSKPSKGEKIFASHAPETPNLQVIGTFSAQDLKIDPQPLRVRIFVRDFNPQSPRVYSPEYIIYLLNEDQHLQWMTRQLTRWQQDSLLVKNREEQLLRVNQELRDLPVEQLNSPETKKKIQLQASAEKSNGAQLNRLSRMGEELILEAARNSQFGPGTLENWAEILGILKDIGGNRMPSVEDLLGEASKQSQLAAGNGGDSDPSSQNKVQNSGDSTSTDSKESDNEQKKSASGPMIGQNRQNSSGSNSPSGESEDKDQPEKPPIPLLVDKESSLQAEDPNKEEEKNPDVAESSKGGSPRLSLPGTTLKDLAPKSTDESCPAGEKMAEAVQEQENLLAEFEKVSDELNRILADLEGSTFVKRLKAASRAQTQMAGTLANEIAEAFGIPSDQQSVSSETVLQELQAQDKVSLSKMDQIHQDMKAYYQRKQFTKFKNVLDEMEKLDPFTGLDIKSEVIPEEIGWSFTMSEFWADTFDRWAEDLVDPASGGT